MDYGSQCAKIKLEHFARCRAYKESYMLSQKSNCPRLRTNLFENGSLYKNIIFYAYLCYFVDSINKDNIAKKIIIIPIMNLHFKILFENFWPSKSHMYMYILFP